MKKTVVLGASPNPSRYSYLATSRLKEKGFEVIPVGIRAGIIDDIPIQTDNPVIGDVHTVTLYLNPSRQSEYLNYVLALKPKRVIFNPGAENTETEAILNEKGIETVNACTLVLLSIGSY